MRADSGGAAFVDASTWDALQPKGRTQEEGRRAGGRKPNNPDRYPLSTRIIDLTDGCGSTLHGRKSGERLIYGCGRYVNSGGAECHHNTVDADAMLKHVLDALVECVTKAGGEAPDEEDAALPLLRRRIEELDQDRESGSVSTSRATRGASGHCVAYAGALSPLGRRTPPVRVHGAQHVAVEEAVPAASPPLRLATQPVHRLDLISAEPATAVHDDHGVSLDTPRGNQGVLVWCLAPLVESGAEGGDGVLDGIPDGPISGMVQFRTVSNVGATRFERATSTSRT